MVEMLNLQPKHSL